MTMIEKSFSESGRQHLLVIYVFTPILLYVIFNEYIFLNIVISILITGATILIYHLIIGFRFHKKILLYKDYLLVNYPFGIIKRNETVLLYDKIEKIFVNGGYGANQPVLKFYFGNEKIKFITNEWDMIVIVKYLKIKCKNAIFDFSISENMKKEIDKNGKL